MKLPNWLKRKRQPSAELPPPTWSSDKIREFVYLDEVSVYSLASSSGKVPATTLTESATREASDSIGATAGATAPFAKAEMQTQLAHKRSSGTQVERKYNIQATFDSVHEDLAARLILRHAPEVGDTTDGAGDNVGDMLERWRKDGLAQKSADLHRGAIVELSVELAAHKAFELSTVMTDLGQMFLESPIIAESVGRSNAEMAVQMGSLLDRLLVDLIPIQGVVQDYKVIQWGTDTWVVHSSAFSHEPSMSSLRSAPLMFAGVTEKELYWKNPRRLLYSDLKFDVMARIAQPGLRTQWSPVKLLDTLRRAMPDLDLTSLDFFMADNPLEADASAPTLPPDAVGDLVPIALDLYRQVAELSGVTPKDEQLAALRERFSGQRLPDTGILAKLEAVNPVVEMFYFDWPDIERDMDAVAPLRLQSVVASGAPIVPIPAAPAPASSAPQSNTPDDYYLEAEIIAMYW